MTSEQEALAREALSRYDVKAKTLRFLRHNENLTLRVEADSGVYALRVHKPVEGFSLSIFGVDDDVALFRAEAELLRRLSLSATFPVQTPVAAKDGEPVCLLACGAPACLLHWIEGEEPPKAEREKYAYAMGQLAARLHSASRGIALRRLEYGRALVARMRSALLDAGASLDSAHIDICLSATDEIARTMERLEANAESRCLIHADMSFGNVLLTPRGLAPIDFSLSGYGFREQECGMLLTNFNCAEARREAVRGYEDESGLALDLSAIDAFFAMSILLFIACQHTRYAGEEWFQAGMKRWCGDTFEPLCAGRGLVTL